MSKILFCAKSASHIANFHEPYIKHYKSLGYEIHTISDGLVHSQYVDESFDIPISKKSLSFKNLIASIKIANIIKKQNYDIISIHSSFGGVVFRIALKLAKPSAYVIHIAQGYKFEDNDTRKSKFYIWREKLLSKTTDALITMNKQDYNTAVKHNLCDNIILTNSIGINIAKFPILDVDTIKAQRLVYGAYDESTVILCVGEFSKRRNQQMILKAFREILNKKDNVFLVFAGTGECLGACKRLAKKLRIEDNVHFLGFVEDINLIYRSADIVVSSSISEGLPFNIMEALFCGVPVVASLIKGHVDVLENNFNSLLFESENIQELVSCLYLLIDDKKLYQSIKANCYLPQEFYKAKTKSEISSIYDIFYKKI